MIDAEIRELFPDTYSIEMRDQVHSYLLIGKEKALLIDSGWGIGDLNECVKGLTSKPVLLVNTHGHLDHIYGNHQFEEYAIHEDDGFMVDYEYTPERRAAFLARFRNGGMAEGIDPDAWCQAKPGGRKTLKDGECLELGGRKVEVIHAPGHTGGSICLLDRNTSSLASGDTMYEGTIMLHFFNSATLEVYGHSIARLLERSAEFDRLLPGHARTPIDAGILNELLEGIKTIISGGRKGIARTVFSKECLACDFDGFSVTYSSGSL